MILKTQNLITWILIKRGVCARDLAKVCNFVALITKIEIPPLGWVSFLRRKKYVANRLSKNGRLRLLDSIANC